MRNFHDPVIPRSFFILSQIGRLGGYKREAAIWLTQAGYLVAVMNARRGRSVARSMNQQAKTDQVDAQV